LLDSVDSFMCKQSLTFNCVRRVLALVEMYILADGKGSRANCLGSGGRITPGMNVHIM